MREDRTAPEAFLHDVESVVEDHTPVIPPWGASLPEREADEADADDPEARPEHAVGGEVPPEVVPHDHDDADPDHAEHQRPVPARTRLRALLALRLDLIALAGALLAGAGLRH